jgi:hypothetical protein
MSSAGLLRYVRDSYPPVVSAAGAAALAAGGLALFASLAVTGATGVALSSVLRGSATIFLDLLLIRAVDDIRDADYDRRMNPERPLASGAVTERQLLALVLACAGGMVLLNAAVPAALAVLVGQLAYIAVLLGARAAWKWPADDRLVLGLVISAPAQLLLYLYLFELYRDAAPAAMLGGAAWVWVILLLFALHIEFAKKLVRRPCPGERTYVRSVGAPVATAVTILSPAAAYAVYLAHTHVPAGWAALPALPLLLVAAAAFQYLGARHERWPIGLSGVYLLLTLVTYLIAVSA